MVSFFKYVIYFLHTKVFLTKLCWEAVKRNLFCFRVQKLYYYWKVISTLTLILSRLTTNAVHWGQKISHTHPEIIGATGKHPSQATSRMVFTIHGTNRITLVPSYLFWDA